MNYASQDPISGLLAHLRHLEQSLAPSIAQPSGSAETHSAPDFAPSPTPSLRAPSSPSGHRLASERHDAFEYSLYRPTPGAQGATAPEASAYRSDPGSTTPIGGPELAPALPGDLVSEFDGLGGLPDFGASSSDEVTETLIDEPPKDSHSTQGGPDDPSTPVF